MKLGLWLVWKDAWVKKSELRVWDCRMREDVGSQEYKKDRNGKYKCSRSARGARGASKDFYAFFQDRVIKMWSQT